MKRYRFIQITYKHFLIILFVVCFACFPSYAQVTGTLPLNDPNTVLKIVLSAINNYQLPQSGKGTAIMKMMNPEFNKELFDGKELTVDFKFKGTSSRTDIFETSIDTKGSRLFSEAVTDKQVINFTPPFETAHIDGVQEHEKIGLDFHPDVFMHFSSSTLAELLKGGMEHPPDYASVEVDTDGILHYIAGVHLVQQDGEGFDEDIKLSFDTRKGLLPVSYFMKNKYVDPNKDWGREAKFEWAKFGSGWYPTQAEYFVQPGMRKHVVFTVKDFTPNVDVPDREFTLDRMNIPDGTTVYDSIKGITYQLGTSPIYIENLEKPLKDAVFIKKIEEKQSDLVNQETKSNGYQNQKSSSVNDVNSQKSTTIGQLNTRSIWKYGITIVCVVSIFGIIVFFKNKHAS